MTNLTDNPGQLVPGSHATGRHGKTLGSGNSSEANSKVLTSSVPGGSIEEGAANSPGGPTGGLENERESSPIAATIEGNDYEPQDS